jgi:transposase
VKSSSSITLGTRLQIHDPLGGPAREASLFVAVLGASSYTFADATGSQELQDWIGSHIRAFEILWRFPDTCRPR